MEIEGKIVNVLTKEVYPGRIGIEGERISFVERTGTPNPLTLAEVIGLRGPFVLPGFVDGHIHIESSMLTPSYFGQIAVTHGTTSVVSDPHEIANVTGMDGLEFMTEDARRSPVNIYYTVPSCVPATDLETAGAAITPEHVRELLKREEFVALGEMMNYPGVLAGEEEVMAKIEAAKRAAKPVDGHAPLLSGRDLARYVSAGISTDHESSTPKEAMEKARLGMKIQVRQGSAARNLPDLLGMYEVPGTMTVSDDRHPGELLSGHMDSHLRLLLDKGVALGAALRSMTVDPCEHYGIEAGALAPGKLADVVILEDFEELKVAATFVRGAEIYDGRGPPVVEPAALGPGFEPPSITKEDLRISAEGAGDRGKYEVRVIGVTDGQLTTEKKEGVVTVRDGYLAPNVADDILPLAVIDRHKGEHIGRGFVAGFGLREGALCSTIAHDSHNIICVGASFSDMERAVSLLSETGGIAATGDGAEAFLPLPVAGLMTPDRCGVVAEKLADIRALAKRLGCELTSPVITLSFLALLVIPSLKLSDRGLFDSDSFEFVDVVL